MSISTHERPWVERYPPGVSKEIAFNGMNCAMNLTNYMRPKVIIFVDALPKSPVGKILRRELKNT